jgi:hypothetical protein
MRCCRFKNLKSLDKGLRCLLESLYSVDRLGQLDLWDVHLCIAHSPVRAIIVSFETRNGG